jgi:hypothetical protein
MTKPPNPGSEERGKNIDFASTSQQKATTIMAVATLRRATFASIASDLLPGSAAS